MPGTVSEYYQCCLYPGQCQAFYLINLVLLFAFLVCFCAGLILVKWFRSQSLLWIACFFQAVVLVWRILYSGVGGYSTASYFEYVTYRTSDPGDVPSFCIPLALLLYDMKQRAKIPEDERKACGPRSFRLVLLSFGLFAVYSVFWGYLYLRSKNVTFSLNDVDYGTGIVIALFIIVFSFLGIQLRND